MHVYICDLAFHQPEEHVYRAHESRFEAVLDRHVYQHLTFHLICAGGCDQLEKVTPRSTLARCDFIKSTLAAVRSIRGTSSLYSSSWTPTCTADPLGSRQVKKGDLLL
jgi:hypothetical protein